MGKVPDDLEKVQAVIDQLGEHFDSVQIFTTRHDEGGEGGTVNVALGSGNFYSRYGQCREWIVKQEERTRESVRKET